MSFAAYITNASKDKQCEPNQTAPDLDSHYLSLPIYKPIMSANICSKSFEYRSVFMPVTSLRGMSLKFVDGLSTAQHKQLLVFFQLYHYI